MTWFWKNRWRRCSYPSRRSLSFLSTVATNPWSLTRMSANLYQRSRTPNLPTSMSCKKVRSKIDAGITATGSYGDSLLNI